MAWGGLLRMALSPLLALLAYQVLRPLSPAAALAAGAVVMLAAALAPGGRPTVAEA